MDSSDDKEATPPYGWLSRPGAHSVSVPLYVVLLHLATPEATKAVDAIRARARASGSLDADLISLLRERNWRPNLVAATAIALGYGGASTIEEVWAAFDRGTWVTPQLAVAASLRDPDFEAKARHHIEAWSSSPAARRDPKALSALIHLCSIRPACSSWLDEAVAQPEVQQALAQDRLYDRGDRLAHNWLEQSRSLKNA